MTKVFYVTALRKPDNVTLVLDKWFYQVKDGNNRILEIREQYRWVSTIHQHDMVTFATEAALERAMELAGPAVLKQDEKVLLTMKSFDL